MPWSNIHVSSMWRSVSLSDLVVKNMRRAAEYFWRTLRCFIRSSGNETLCGTLNITSRTNVILEGEIKDAKMSSFSSDFQRTLISFEFSIWIINEFGNLNQGHEESSVVLKGWQNEQILSGVRASVVPNPLAKWQRWYREATSWRSEQNTLSHILPPTWKREEEQTLNYFIQNHDIKLGVKY